MHAHVHTYTHAHTHAHTHSAPLHVSDDLAAAWRMVESQRVAQKVQEEAAQRVAAHKEHEEEAAQRVSHTAQEDAPERVFARKVREEAEMRVLAALKAVGASSPTLRHAAGVMAVTHHIDSRDSE